MVRFSYNTIILTGNRCINCPSLQQKPCFESKDQILDIDVHLNYLKEQTVGACIITEKEKNSIVESMPLLKE